MSIHEIGINLIVAIVVAITTASITAWLSLTIFYKKELWLRKEKKYSDIINNLGKSLKEYCDMIDVEIGKRSRNSNGDDDFNLMVREAVRELELISITPSLTIDNKVRIILDNLLKESEMKGDELQGNWFPYFDRMYVATKKAMDEIDEIARKDLKIKQGKTLI